MEKQDIRIMFGGNLFYPEIGDILHVMDRVRCGSYSADSTIRCYVIIRDLISSGI